MVSLKIPVIVLVILVAFFSSAISAAAAEASSNGKVVQISRFSAFPSDSDILISVNLRSDRKLSDARLVIAIPEMGIMAKQRVDFSSKRKQTVRIEVPIPAGLDPYLRIAFNSDEGRRIKHVPVILQ